MAVHCVNHKSHSVIDLAKELGVSPLVAAAKIALWQEKNGLDKFPDSSNLLEKVKQEAVPEVEENIESVERDYSNLVDENTTPLFDDVNDIVEDTISSDNQAILFNNNTGNLRIDHILNNISNNIDDLSPHAKEIINRAQKLISKSKATVILVDEKAMKSADTVMQYDADNNEIQISLERLKKFNSKDVVVAFLHETVHSITVNSLAKNPKDRTFAEQELADVVNKFMKKYKDSNLASEYGFTDEFEFVAEFYANPEFRDKVKETSDSFWKELVDAVRRFFNLGANKEYKELFDTIINFTEGTYQDYSGIKHYGRIFAKEKPEFIKPELITLQDKLEDLVKRAKDRISQARARTAKTKKPISKKDKKDHLKNIDSLLTELETLSETEQWKVILGYANTMQKTVYQVDKGIERLHAKTKDYRKDNLIDTIRSYEEYLSTYDLVDEINQLVSDSNIHISELTDENKADIKKIKDVTAYVAGRKEALLSEFNSIKREQAIRVLSDAKFNTQVETDHRNRLAKEYTEKGITGESKTEYANRMLNTRDKDIYKADLIKAAEKIVHNPTFDITKFSANWSDPLNTNSKLIQMLTNVLSSARDIIVSLYKDYELKLANLHDQLIKEKGNKAPSELYKNLYEQDKDGNYFFKGTYTIKFRDMYLDEYKPLEKELEEITSKLKDEGITTKTELLKNSEYKEVNDKLKAWLKEHTVIDPTDDRRTGKKWYPKPKYKNKPLTGLDAELLKEALNLANLGHKATGGKRSLVRNTNQAKFYKFPSITKSDFERGLEKDLKGIITQKKAEFTEVLPDDVGYGEAVSNKGEILRGVKVHFRGKIDPSMQSLDVMTMLRKEYLNVIGFTEKSKAETNALLIADISKNKEYLQKSKKTGLPLMNIFNQNQPVETIKGEFTNEYGRIKGLIDRMLYDVVSEHGGTFLGADVNKIVEFGNGLTASIAMSLNLASGTANLFNGFTQTFIEAFGGDVFNVKSLLKAEKLYTLELPKTLADMANPVKKSFVNQVLEMYDVFGGFDPSTQEFIRNTVARKLASRRNLNGLNEMGEHAMNSILTMSVIDSLKVMNINNKFIDKDGNEVSEDKAASLLDMLKMNESGKLVMDDKVKFTKHNLTTEYHKGGKVHVNLLIKNKVFDLYGVYDNNFKNEVSKTVLGKLVMMFKNYFLGGVAYRYTGISTAWKNKAELTEDDINYSSAKKEYTEGIYTSVVRYLKEGVLPSIKSMQLMYMKDVYNSLSEHEKANLKKATLEIMLTSVLLPSIGALLVGAAADDDDELWFLIYQLRRLESEMSQFRDIRETTKLVTNPVAGIKLLQNGANFIQQIITPINFFPDEDDNFFSYLDEDAKGKNELGKATKKLIPVWSNLNKDYQQLYGMIN